LLAAPASAADEPLVPPADDKPILQLDAGGPMAAVTALAFAPDGKTLYVGGFDKVVRVWTLDEKSGAFTARATYHVPIGPGMNGLINALAVSPDGRWLAVAGSGAIRGTAGFGETGLIVPLPGRLSPAMEHDWGAIYLFDLNKDKDAVTPLRAHRAPVLALKFLPARQGKPPLLVSLGREGKESMAVRLWDAAAGRLLAEHVDLPDPGGNEPPGLEAWHTGPKDKDVGVAVPLARDFARGKDAPPGRLHYWDVANNRLQSTELDPAWQFTNTAAFRPGKTPDGGVLFTGGLWLKKGDAAAGAYVSGWPVADGKLTKDGDLTEFVNKGALKTLAFLPDPDGGPPDLAAAVEQFPGRSPPYRLLLIGRTRSGGFRDEKASVPLWESAGPVAVTAASPDGARLAVSGGADHDVWIYSVADLLKGKAEPLQRIASTGVRATGVAFVRKGATPGLLLRQDQPGGRAPREWVLDANGAGVQEGRKGWEDDGPDLDGWKVASGDGMTYSVAKDGDKVGDVHLAAGQSKTFRPLLPCFALLPPCKPLNKALLAVGYVEEGVSYLELFDVAADRRVRRFSGHVNVVRGLAFGKDGRLLASASDDETVGVWSLTDLDKVVGRGGAIPGLVVEQKGEKVVVAAPDDTLSADNKKALEENKVGVGDTVEGVVAGKTLKAFRSPQDLYDAIPQTVFKLRFDSEDGINQFDRADYMFGTWREGSFHTHALVGGGAVRGTFLDPKATGSQIISNAVDDKLLSATMEYAFSQRLSVFVDVPFQFVHFGPNIEDGPADQTKAEQTQFPESEVRNAKSDPDGMGDVQFGFKYAFVAEPDWRYLTFQFRTYVPSGDSGLGLGTGHVSVEPGLLAFQRLTDQLVIQGEFTDWIPISAGQGAGNVITYGGGIGYDVIQRPNLRVTPVVEVVGWTCLGGTEGFDGTVPGTPVPAVPTGVQSINVNGTYVPPDHGFMEANGDTIVNAKFGVWTYFGQNSDVYAGYGRSLTGDRWYRDIYSLEYRLHF